MAICTFFGHKDTPKEIEPTLRSALIDLIINKDTNLFYVGNQGNFDNMVIKNLQQLSEHYTNIKYYVVLSYMPVAKNIITTNHFDTIYPEGLEKTPLKFAIDKRNRWMIDKSDYVVTYVIHNFGGASKFKTLSEKKGKTVINLSEINSFI